MTNYFGTSRFRFISKGFNCRSVINAYEEQFRIGPAHFGGRRMSYYYDEGDKETPIGRTLRILKRSFGEVKEYLDDPDRRYAKKKIFPSYCDILVIGGGAIGSSISYWLKQRALDGLRVVVVDKDSTYQQSSTTLSVGGLRQQFSLKENIEMSLFGAHFLRNISDYLSVTGEDPPNVCFSPHGYLFLASEAGVEILEENVTLQASLGAKSELLSADNLKKKFPWINTKGVVLGCHGVENEGWFDPWSLLQAFKNKSISLGTEYVEGEVIGFEYNILPASVSTEVDDDYHDSDVLRSVLIKCPDGVTRSISFAICILAGGPQSGHIAKLAGIGVGKKSRETPLPVEPRKRYVYCFHCPDGPGLNTPLTIDPTGTYFRREGLCGNYICGRSPEKHEEPDVSNLEVDDEFFNEKLWPVLADRVPAFENLKVVSSWAGFYDYNYYDQNVIIGKHPYCWNLYFCTGCSGHGIQQAPALGRAVMELIVNGRYSTIDLSNLSFNRLIDNKPMLERNIV
ncbi:FAD-dependent oxidoreductase domain-containing protein 1-like isoform X2 [Lycorma delicatula]|uniref:FAD-dependent oxidoreductase domain-containing protein 1-like isoform X2 n=1 Tax=Lycorma delicatula TaxID=130591 RepID=UPI003F5145A4